MLHKVVLSFKSIKEMLVTMQRNAIEQYFPAIQCICPRGGGGGGSPDFK